MTGFRDPQWRRSLLALAFVGAGMALTAFAALLAAIVASDRWPPALAAARLTAVSHALFACLALLAIVLIGLGMSVALRQLSARFMGADFTASGETK
ncbi:hypothetical protein IP88_09565 [alpha proteobacterium AAP81b]|nr:hypothetical protein IP88_09565 [alpha proteobacterium AAP81b]